MVKVVLLASQNRINIRLTLIPPLKIVFLFGILLLPLTIKAQASEYTFWSISQRSSECALVFGTNQDRESISVDLCKTEDPKLKKLNSSAYISSVNFTGMDNGFALFGRRLVRIENNRLKAVNGLPINEDDIVFAQFVDHDRGCISYSNGGVACTKNGAVTFQTFESLADVRPWDVSVNDRAVILVGQTPPNELDGKVVNQIGSLDGKKLSLMPQEFIQIWLSERGCYGLAINQANQLSATSDCGFIWNDMATLDSRPDDIFILDELNIWFFKDGVFHSKDGGRNWRKLAAFAPNEIVRRNGMVFVDSKHGWIASMWRIFETNDGGVTWKEVKLP